MNRFLLFICHGNFLKPFKIIYYYNKNNCDLQFLLFSQLLELPMKKILLNFQVLIFKNKIVLTFYKKKKLEKL